MNLDKRWGHYGDLPPSAIPPKMRESEVIVS